MMPLSYGASEITWIVTTEVEPWRNGCPVAYTEASGGKYTVETDTKTFYQEIDGSGGCFNERGWAAPLSILNPEEKTSRNRLVFS